MFKWRGREKERIVQKEVLVSGTKVEFADGGKLLRGEIMGKPLPGWGTYYYYIKSANKTYLIIEHAIEPLDIKGGDNGNTS